MSPRNDGTLAKKQISIKLHNEQGALCLYMIERYNYFDPSAPPHALIFFKTSNDAIDYLNRVMAMFSKLSHDLSHPPDMLASYHRNYTQSRIKEHPPQQQESSFPYYPHQRNELLLRLPMDRHELLLLLGTLDNFLKHMHSHAKEDGYEIEFIFNGDEIKPDNHVISNRVCKWMHGILGRNSKLNTTFKQTYELLTELRTIDGSLTTHIQQLLFPNSDPLTIMRVVIKDPWTLHILNPEIKISTKTQYVMEWLRYILNKKSNKGINKNHDKNVHGEIRAKFEKLKASQKIAWNLMIDTLHGKEANDGGFLSEDFYEIGLLRKSFFEITDDFKFILNFEFFLQDKAYKTLYLPSKDDVLTKELIKTCGYLGLTFEPNQNFHTGRVRFTKESSLKLMQLGFHWSEPLAKKMLKKHNMISWQTRVFKIVYKNERDKTSTPEDFPANLLPGIMKTDEPEMLEEAIATMATPK